MYPAGRNNPQENKLIRQSTPLEIQRDYPSKITYAIGRVESGDLVFHVKLPSRKKHNLIYDVILMFCPENEEDMTKPLADITFRAFSNSPSFYYRYAKIFRESGMGVGFLQDKLYQGDTDGSRAATEIGYERTVYTALWILQKDNILPISFYTIAHRARKTTMAKIAKGVFSTSEVDAMMRAKKDTAQERARKENIADRKADRETAKNPNVYAASKGVRGKKVKQVGNVSRVKRVSHGTQSHKVPKSSKMKKI